MQNYLGKHYFLIESALIIKVASVGVIKIYLEVAWHHEKNLDKNWLIEFMEKRMYKSCINLGLLIYYGTILGLVYKGIR